MIVDYLPCFYKQNELEIAGFYQGTPDRKEYKQKLRKLKEIQMFLFLGSWLTIHNLVLSPDSNWADNEMPFFNGNKVLNRYNEHEWKSLICT